MAGGSMKQLTTVAAAVIVFGAVVAALSCVAEAAGATPNPFPMWNQAHHDGRNSGRVPYQAAVAQGHCQTWKKIVQQTDEEIRTNAVFSLDGSFVYYMSETPTGIHKLWKRDAVMGITNWTMSWQLPMTGPTIGAVTVAGTSLANEMVYVVFENTIYAVPGAWAGTPTPVNVVWSRAMANPILAPLRITEQMDVLIATSTNATFDQNGAVYGLNPATGDVLWTFNAADKDGTSWGVRITPAVTRLGVLYICFGQTMVALDVHSGKELARVTTLPLLAQLGSAPVVSTDMLHIYLHSKVGDLWRFDVNATQAPMKFLPQWVCQYSQPTVTCLNLTHALVEDLDVESMPEHFRMQTTLPLTPGAVVQDDLRASPALGMNDDTLVFPLYATQALQGGVHCVNMKDGSRIWRYLSTEDSPDLGDMMSRSSPVLDSEGNVFIGMDQINPQSTVPPVLLALSPTGMRLWVDAGGAPGAVLNPIGTRSAILGYAPSQGVGSAMVVFSRQSSITAFGPGVECASASQLYECSGNGNCQCQTGECYCAVFSCYLPPDCSLLDTCNDNGMCQNGVCICTDPCWQGLDCGTPVSCNGHGSCQADGCICDSGCYSGDFCEDVNTCNGQGFCDDVTGTCVCQVGFTGDTCATVIQPTNNGLGGGWIFLIVLVVVSTVGAAGFLIARRIRNGRWTMSRGEERKPLSLAAPRSNVYYSAVKN